MAWPPRDPGEAGRFVAQCVPEGLLPLLFSAAPPEVAPALTGWRAMEAANRARTQVIAREIESFPELIGEEFAYMKGTDIGRRLYPAPELRPQADIDVLVPRARVDAVTARLESRGHRRFYQHANHRSRRWPDRSFDVGAVTLEIHHSFVQRSRAAIDYDGVWQRRQPFLNAARLDDVDAMLVSVLNIAKDDLATPLLRYLDLWLMLQHDPQLFAAAEERAGEWRIRNAFHAVMRVAAVMFPDLKLSLRPALVDRFIDADRAAASRDRKRNVTRRELLWRKFWLVDGIVRPVVYAADDAAMTLSGLLRRQ